MLTWVILSPNQDSAGLPVRLVGRCTGTGTDGAMQRESQAKGRCTRRELSCIGCQGESLTGLNGNYGRE